jgi:hypothetical protein
MPPNSNSPDLNDKQPTPSPPPQQNITSTQRIIQPLSSEAEIRAALVTVTSPTKPPAPPSTYANPSVYNPANTSQQPYEVNKEPESYYNDSTLITEPLTHPVTQAYQSQSTSQPIPVDGPKKKRKVILSVFLLVVILGIAGAAYLFQGLGSVSVDSLVEEKVQNTIYLRPKQWKTISGASTSSYGDNLGKDGKSTALVAVSVSPTQQPALITTSEATLALIRIGALDQLSDEVLAPAFQNGSGPCASKVIIQKETDTSSTPTYVGIYRLTATCDSSVNGDKYIMKMHGIAGHDGYLRTIALAAMQSSWNKNGEAYNKIIGSLNQTDSKN